MSSDELKEIIDLGNDFTAGKYYGVAVATNFLTLADEIKYAWHGRKSFVFAIFLANRYLPMGYQFWLLYTLVQRYAKRCEKTAFFEVLAAVGTPFLAQVVLTLRIYAITQKNRTITSCLSVITVSQFILGLYLIVFAAKSGAAATPQIPLPLYVTCVSIGRKSLDIAHPIISLVYDFLAFSVVVYLVVRSNLRGVPIPRIFRTIARDATYYFLVIFTSQFLFVAFVLFANPNIKLLPGIGNVVYVPVMVSRLLLSLKKANDSRKDEWNLGEPTVRATMRFADRRGISLRDDIHLDTFASTQEETRSSAWT